MDAVFPFDGEVSIPQSVTIGSYGFGTPSGSARIEGVPWISQLFTCGSWDDTRTCGPTVAAMAEAYVSGKALSADFVRTFVDQTTGGWPCGNYTGIQQLSPVLEQHGVSNVVKTFDAESLLAALQKNHPVIAPSLTQNTSTDQINPSGAKHFMLVVGITPTTVVVHDPGRSSESKGRYRSFPLSDFIAAWQKNSSKLYGIEVGGQGSQPPQPAGDFEIDVSPRSSIASRGSTVAFTVSVRSLGLNGDVTLSALNLPGNQVLIGTGFVPKTLSVRANQLAESTLTIVTNASTPVGVANITVQGKSGDKVHTRNIELAVSDAATAPPSVVTASASDVGSSSATLNGIVNANGSATNAFFQWGPSNGYGSTTESRSVGAGRGAVAVSVQLTGLSPNTTYHTRVVASNGDGTANGNDVVFRTLDTSASADFAVAVTPSSRTVAQGATTSYTVTVQSLNGFNSSVEFFALDLPGNRVLPGTAWSPASVTPPPNGTATSTFTLVTDAQTPRGTSTITFEARGGGFSRRATSELTVTGGASADFSVAVSPSNRTVSQGGTTTYTVTLQSLSGFNSTVELFALNLPGNRVLPGTAWSPANVTPSPNGTATSTFTLATDAQTPTGTFTITFEARSGGLTRSTTGTVTVSTASTPDFSVSVSPNTRSVTQGGTTTYTLTVQSLNGFNSAVEFFALNLPGNRVLAGTAWNPPSVTPSPNGTSTSTFTLVTDAQTPTGAFTITFEARGGGLTRNVTGTVTVNAAAMPDFSVSVSPNSRSVTQGGNVTYAVTVQSLNGFNSSVEFFALNLPGNRVLPGTAWSPTTVTPPPNGTATSTFTFVTDTQTPTGTFTITFEGRGGGGTRNATGTVTVNAAATPTFSVSVSPNSRTVTQGGTITYGVTVQSLNGFSGSIDLFALNLPGNRVLPGTAWAPTSVTPPPNGSANSTFTLVTDAQTPTGTFTITFEGRGGGLTRNTTGTVTVNLAAAPTLRVDGGTSSTRQIGQTFSFIGSGFTTGRTVTRTVSPPVNGSSTLSPTLSADGSGNISWSFTPACGNPRGTFTITAIDDATGRVSNSIMQTVTGSPSCP